MIGTRSLLCEVELVEIVERVFRALGVRVALKMNNRKILYGIAEAIGHADKMMDITVAIDKLEKVGLENVKAELLERGLSEEAVGRLQPILELSGDNTQKLDRLSEVLAMSETGLRGLGCVREVFPSDANFLLARFDDADDVYAYLSRCGVLVRNRSRVTLCGGMLRITIGTPAENLRVIAALRGYDNGEPPRRELSDRVAVVERRTAETDIYVSVDLDGNPADSHIDTGLKFFDHMLMQFPHHGGFSLTAVCRGDLEVDEHHTIEDTAIALGEAFRRALGDKRGIERYGFTLPMDESSASVMLDLGGRVEVVWDVAVSREMVGDTPVEMYPHFFKSFATALGANLHVRAGGDNAHHVIEAVFKAVARSLRMAIRRDGNLLASSKGVI